MKNCEQPKEKCHSIRPCRCGNQLPTQRQIDYFAHRLAHLEPEDAPDYFVDAKEQLSQALMNYERAIEQWKRKPIYCMDCGVQIFDYADWFCAECLHHQEVVSSTSFLRHPEWQFPFLMLEAGPGAPSKSPAGHYPDADGIYPDEVGRCTCGTIFFDYEAVEHHEWYCDLEQGELAGLLEVA